MNGADSRAPTLETVRRGILILLVLGMAGTAAELVFIGHFADGLQVIPLALMTVASVMLLIHGAFAGPATVRGLQATMVLFLVSGAVGMAFHARASIEFQRDVDPSIGSRALFWKVMAAKAPPALAPGMMAQLGLLGLLFTYRHPALRYSSRHSGGST